MNVNLDIGAEAMILAVTGLALVAALILAWRSGVLVTTQQPAPVLAIQDGREVDALSGLQGHLTREFLSAARAAEKIRPDSLAGERVPYLAERIAAASHSVTRQLLILQSKGRDRWLISACVGQARLVGVSAIQVETAALAAARSPADRVIAAQLEGALTDLDEAVDNLHTLVQSSTEGRGNED